MGDAELITRIKKSLSKITVPVADVPSDASLLTGYCKIEGESEPLNFVIKAKDGYSTIYMIAPYSAEAFKNENFYQELAAVNLRLAKGHFNADAGTMRLIYKWVLPAVHFEGNCDELVKEFIILPAAMIFKYKANFVKS